MGCKIKSCLRYTFCSLKRQTQLLVRRSSACKSVPIYDHNIIYSSSKLAYSPSHVTILFNLVYMTIFNLYKSKIILILQSVFFVNLISLSAAALFISADRESKKSTIIAINVSVGVALFQFVIIVIWSILKECQCCLKKKKECKSNESCDNKLNSNYYRDSILNELYY